MKKEKSSSTFYLLKRFIPFIKPYRIIAFITLIISLVSMIINTLEAYFIRNLIDAALASKANLLVSYIFFMCLVIFIGVIAMYFLKYLFGYFSNNILRDMKNFIMSHIQKLQVSYIDKNHSGDLISRLTTDISIVQNFIGNELLNVFLQLIYFIAASVYMSTISLKLLLFSIMFTPPALILLNVVNKSSQEYSEKSLEYLGKSISTVKDSIGGIYMIKAFNIKSFLLKKYNDYIEKSLYYNLKFAKISIWNTPFNVTLRLIPTIICITYGGYLSLNKHITPGQFLSFTFLLGFVVWPLALLPGIIINLKGAMGAGKRIVEILDLPCERQDGEIYTEEGVSTMISFENVSFSYNNDTKVLNNISFVLEKGKKIALVGLSGSGKSTIFKLICGFYNPEKGDIKILDNNIYKWNLNAIRSKISFVSQDIFLFPTTIYENISYGRIDETKDKVIAAAKAANAHDFIIDLPNGYDSIVGERGIQLSVGQRQRIVIARAIIKGSPIILMDEPTSALDTHSEALVQEAFDNVLKNKSLIIVAHRLSTIKEVDEVLVIDRGEIVEKGTHDHLMNTDSFYKQLYIKQFMKVEDEKTA